MVSIIALIEPVRGQGLMSTKWYVWCPWFGISLLQQYTGFSGQQIHMIELQLQLILVKGGEFEILKVGRPKRLRETAQCSLVV